jgi:glyoxylase-like metal-dependent hydrolase (beta-lactamase superfamily II)
LSNAWAVLALVVVMLAAAEGSIRAQQDQHEEKPDVHLLHVQGRVYMLAGAGANITVQVGDRAVLLVDAGIPQMSEQVLSAIRTLSNAPIAFIVDTSMDEDHIGGNQNLAKAGHFTLGLAGEATGASVIAHLKALNRMSAPTGKKPPVAEDLWPTDTYDNDRWELFNDEAVIIEHPHAAHTDGDSTVFFRRSDVVSAGDVFTPERYPMIESQRGGTINGEIEALNQVIDIMVPKEGEEGGTYVIPGHGRLCDRAEIVNYRDMVTIVRDRIEDMVNKGMTLEQVKAAKPTLDYDGIYGANAGPWTTEMFIEAVYRDLSQSKR